jgi:threo-3-hydroxy-L-aspartate ammonia-lyase
MHNGTARLPTAAMMLPARLPAPARMLPGVALSDGVSPGAAGGKPAPAGTGLVTAEDIRAAAERIDGVAVRTPLLPYPPLRPRDRQHGLLVKPETLQPTGSFKVRGAYAAISALPGGQRGRGVIAHSSGNHAQAVAYAAAVAGVPAVVVVPETASAVKVDSARALGAEVVTVEPTLAARMTATQELAARHGYAVIPPFDDRTVIAGQGTIGLEIVADLASTGKPAAEMAAVVLVPVSGGGLISGIAAAVKATHPEALVIGVEPELAADALESLRAGERTAWPADATRRTIADALRVEQVGELTLAHMRAHVDGIVTVSEDEIRAAVQRVARDMRLIAEPGGAVAVAAYLFRMPELPRRQTYVAVLSGGNIAPSLLAELMAEPAR